MLKPYAAVIEVTAAVVAFVAMVLAFVFYCKIRCKNISNKNSETGSSDPSALAHGHPLFGQQAARQFTMEELEQATKQFSEGNLVAHGSFGAVYKGLLRDRIVAIKRRPGAPRDEFVAEVMYLSEIQHRHLVTLIGYCQESGYQMLVFEYLPNGSICNHLYGLESQTKLEFKRRLSIALGAAKGLCHLHGLNPPLIHKNFKTANVLVDENFIVKVADACISTLLEMIEEAGPSQTSDANVYKDPEVGVSGTFTERSDVYSFGVFLLELITGQEALHIHALGSEESLIQWVASRLSSNDFVDQRLVGSFTINGMRDLIRLTLQCVRFPGGRRPKMEIVLLELDRIREKEMALTTVMGDGTATFIKGSELFT